MAKKSISIKKRNNKKKTSKSIKNLKKIGGNSVGGLRKSITSRRRQNKRKTKKGGFVRAGSTQFFPIDHSKVNKQIVNDVKKSGGGRKKKVEQSQLELKGN